MMAGTRRPVSVAILGTAMASFMPAAAQEAPPPPTTPAPQAAPPGPSAASGGTAEIAETAEKIHFFRLRRRNFFLCGLCER